jgi:hypothetical protein
MANTESTDLTEIPEGEAEARGILQRMFARRSTSPRHLVAPGPTEDEIRQLVRAASRAPDHMRLKPFRFVSIGPDARESLADVFSTRASVARSWRVPARRLTMRRCFWP